jgi:putative sporulation protein YyaC
MYAVNEKYSGNIDRTYFNMKNKKVIEEITKRIQRSLPTSVPITIVCIGTDKITGDCLGPLVGMILNNIGINTIGNLEKPVHAKNLDKRLKEVPNGNFVIAVDACLGKHVGYLTIADGSLIPGTGIPDRKLTSVGDLSITGIVNCSGYMEFLVLQNTRLSVVYKMAGIIATAIYEALKNRAKVLPSENMSPIFEVWHLGKQKKAVLV